MSSAFGTSVQGINESLKNDLFSSCWHVIKRLGTPWLCLTCFDCQIYSDFLPVDIQHTEISKNSCQILSFVIKYVGRLSFFFFLVLLFVLFVIVCLINNFAQTTLLIVWPEHFIQMLKVNERRYYCRWL